MITGCNTNILYRGKQFHVQTEDSGRANPHIISHVYHGGTIIASEKTHYGDRIDAADLDSHVRGRIEEQHKMMLKRLTTGKLDAVIDERLGTASAAPTPPPVSFSGEPAVEGAASGAQSSGGITAGADTDPSIDIARPAVVQPLVEPRPARAFGDGVRSEKPLDEVILEYLIDKARDRSSDDKQRPPRRQRPKG